MQDLLPELCDQFPELVNVVEPMFANYGGRDIFGGEIVTIKAYEDNSLVREQVAQPGALSKSVTEESEREQISEEAGPVDSLEAESESPSTEINESEANESSADESND